MSMRFLIFAIIVVAFLICGAKYLQHRAEVETGEWIMDDHRLYQVVDGQYKPRLDVDLKPILKKENI